ncbi:EF-Hand 1, calcium-binding site [Purpureocillium lavendulum]|uniref:EF-Hand 1, calcium-binding site n=1 Tax=Purpureocillium lavendulum TaxID=1247861 RepID=A0AB34FY71_9HYPO|nr:EF-Hand 1, calcium-binding site [Purpureocillium lavendulum]
MDALKNLTNNIPDWQRRLDDLSGQIDRRQAELAAIGEPNTPSTRSLRNKGSSESLKPKDEGPMHLETVDDTAFLAFQPDQVQQNDMPPPVALPFPSSPESENRAALHKQAREAVMAAHSRARVQARKKRRSSSMASAEGPPTTYRTRSMIIVYYDSYVQGFFDELVRFVSTSRNLMRKARMAARVAQIKRMAEMEMPDDEQSPGDDNSMSDGLPSLRYMSTRRLGPMSASRRSGFGLFTGESQPPDIYETLDKSLEFVQSTCEHGAHQFLREAHCEEEINKIRARIGQVLAAARREMERVQREEPELARESAEVTRPRARRPISIRRDLQKSDLEPDKQPDKVVTTSPKAEHEKSSAIEAVSSLEVDTNLEADEGIEDLLPKLKYRSTRQMRSRAH